MGEMIKNIFHVKQKEDKPRLTVVIIEQYTIPECMFWVNQLILIIHLTRQNFYETDDIFLSYLRFVFPSNEFV